MRIEQRAAAASRLAACLLLGMLTAACDEKVVPSTPTPAAAPTVNAVSPSNGSTAGGTLVTITGTGFAAGATVTFGDTPATSVAVAGNTSITALTPPRAPGAVDVVVTNADGQSGRLTAAFVFRPPIPPVPLPSEITPTSGPTTGGTRVTITGLGFTPGNTVSFGTAEATNVVVAANGGSLTATTPPAPAGTVNVIVSNNQGQFGVLPNAFTYVAPAPAASTVSGISPASGPTAGGTHLTISGTGFSAGRVRFVNNDTVPHTIHSDPHPDHTRCPPINAVGFLAPG